jgi:hypothetical protein
MYSSALVACWCAWVEKVGQYVYTVGGKMSITAFKGSAELDMNALRVKVERREWT